MTLAFLVATAATPVLADTYQEYELTYSGTPHGNSATATGFVTLDLSAFSNPSSPEVQCNIADHISSLTLTVSGADSGNGTFTTSNYSGPYGLVYSFSQAVNFNTQLVGQPGFADFNFLNANGDAPVGDNELDIRVDEGMGLDQLAMTSMEPVPVPEPSALALSAAGGLGGLLMYRRRK